MQEKNGVNMPRIMTRKNRIWSVTEMKKELYNLDQYEDILTKEQMRIVCHISKRKAMYLLQSGLISCINTGKKTHNILLRAIFQTIILGKPTEPIFCPDRLRWLLLRQLLR